MFTSPSSFNELVLGLLHPWVFIGLALRYLPGTILREPFSSPSRLKAAWFGAFWAWAGPNVRTRAEACVVPLLRGRWKAGRVIGDDEEGGPPVAGTVIEIGPGSGMWVSLFSDRYLRPSGSDGEGDGVRRRGAQPACGVTKVFGVEPNAELHGPLRQRVREAGLEDVYEVVPVGIEDLASSGRVELGSVDCIVTNLCLCGIPEPEKNIRELYRYLKPGGRWYAFEHVRCFPEQGWAMGAYQGMLKMDFLQPSCVVSLELMGMSWKNSVSEYYLATLYWGLRAEARYGQVVEGGWVVEPC